MARLKESRAEEVDALKRAHEEVMKAAHAARADAEARLAAATTEFGKLVDSHTAELDAEDKAFKVAPTAVTPADCAYAGQRTGARLTSKRAACG